jgi:hypothetical protein
MIALTEIQTDNINQIKLIAKSNLLMKRDFWLFSIRSHKPNDNIVSNHIKSVLLWNEVPFYFREIWIPATKINIVLNPTNVYFHSWTPKQWIDSKNDFILKQHEFIVYALILFPKYFKLITH